MDAWSLVYDGLIVFSPLALMLGLARISFWNKPGKVWYPFVFMFLSVVQSIKYLASCVRRIFL